MRYLIEKGLAVLALLLLLGGQAGAQSGAVNSPVLTIDSEQLFVQSQFGQKFAQDFEARGKILEAENRRIEAELIAEEKELTERRATLPPAKFRSLADAFDEKVEQIRRMVDVVDSCYDRNLLQSSADPPRAGRLWCGHQRSKREPEPRDDEWCYACVHR